jgi:hypothetical protein
MNTYLVQNKAKHVPVNCSPRASQQNEKKMIYDYNAGRTGAAGPTVANIFQNFSNKIEKIIKMFRG